MKIAVYPGSFDPLTNGHIDIIERISKQFDQVIVLISVAPEKQYLFTVEERADLIRKSLTEFKNVVVDSNSALTFEYARKKNANILIRGLRAVADFEYEFSLASMNRKLAPEIETLLMFSRPEFYFISSRSVKEVAKHRGDVSGLVPEPVRKALEGKFK